MESRYSGATPCRECPDATAQGPAAGTMSATAEAPGEGAVALLHVGADGRVSAASGAAAALLGREPHALLGRALADLLVGGADPPGGPPAAGAPYAFTAVDAATGRALDGWSLPSAGGGSLLFLRHAAAAPDAARDRLPLLDRAVAAQAENDARLSLAMEVAGLGAWDLDVPSRVAFLSPVAAGLIGRRSEGPLTLGPEDLRDWVHHEDLERVLEGLRAAFLRESGDYTDEFRVVWPDGETVRWLRSRGRVFRAPSGAPARAVGVWRDVTADRERDDAADALRRRQRNFLRQVLASVTEGRLILCGGVEDLPGRLGTPGAGAARELILRHAAGLAELRAAVRLAAADLGMPPERAYDLVLAAGEAGMNALVHAGGGAVRIGWSDGPSGGAGAGAGVLQVWVGDEGAGISEDALHRATLERGYSSAGSLGQGFSIITQTVDRVWLLTGPEGTTVVLEQDVLPTD